MMNDHNAPLTISVPEAGERYFGLCRNAAYNAAARGEIPTIRIGRCPTDAKARYRTQLETFKPCPTFVIDSGNGIQLLWRLAVPTVLGEPGPGVDGTLCHSPQDQARIGEAEARSAAVMVEFSAKPGTQNIDRLLRLPGTINLPNVKKKREGRVVCATNLIDFQDVTVPLDAFPLPTHGLRQQNAKHRNCSDAAPPAGRSR